MTDPGMWIALGFFLVGCFGMWLGDRLLTQAKHLADTATRAFDAATADRVAVTKAFALAKAGLWEEAQAVLGAAEARAKETREDVA